MRKRTTTQSNMRISSATETGLTMDLRTKREIYLERRYAEACNVISDLISASCEKSEEALKRELIKAELFLNK